MEQFSRSNCLIVYKCEEVPKNGKYLESENYICDKLNGSLSLDNPLQVNKIDIAHSLPLKKNVRGTPIIIKFLCRNQRNEIYAKKKALKGKEMVITKSLTKYRLQLLEAARDAFGWKSVCYMMGDIYICICGHKSTAVLLLGIFELSNLIVIKKLFLKFLFLNYTIFECQLKFNV